MSRQSLSNSMSALRWLYTVVAGFAVIQGIRTLALGPQNELDLQFLSSEFMLFLVFISVTVRFAHGAIRHFYQTYEETQRTLYFHEPLLDFLGLFSQAFLFMLMAFALNDPRQFTTFYLALIAADTIWLILLPTPEPPYRNWLIHNWVLLAVTATALGVTQGDDTTLVITLLVITCVHHVLDYWAPGNWTYYFNGVPEPPGVALVEHRLGRFFLRAGELLWLISTFGLGPRVRAYFRSANGATQRDQSLAALQIYLAGPLFTEAERAFNSGLKQRLESIGGVHVFSPWDECQEADATTANDVFDVNMRGLQSSDLMVAILDGSQVDDGTAWEIGYFSSRGGAERVIGFSTDLREKSELGEPVNIMISKSTKVLARDEAELLRQVRDSLGVLNDDSSAPR